MVSSPAYSPGQLFQDNAPGERSGQSNILLCRRCWLGAEGEAVVQDLVLGCDKCINRMIDCISLHVVQIMNFPTPALVFDVITPPCNSRSLIS